MTDSFIYFSFFYQLFYVYSFIWTYSFHKAFNLNAYFTITSEKSLLLSIDNCCQWKIYLWRYEQLPIVLYLDDLWRHKLLLLSLRWSDTNNCLLCRRHK